MTRTARCCYPAERAPFVVVATTENDRVLCRDRSGTVGIHSRRPLREEAIEVLGDPVEGQQLVHDYLSHRIHCVLHLVARSPGSGRRTVWMLAKNKCYVKSPEERELDRRN